MKIALAGAGGRMGRTLLEAVLADPALELGAAFDVRGSSAVGTKAGGITIAAWSERYRHKVPRRADAVALINTTTGDLIRRVQLLPAPSFE